MSQIFWRPAPFRATERCVRDGGGDELAYRECGCAQGHVFVAAILKGTPAPPDEVRANTQTLIARRAASQPVRAKTGGSTFRNPSKQTSGSDGSMRGLSAWRLIEAAGCRGLRRGEAEVSECHANFLINRGEACAADLEALGEEVRERVRQHCGVALEWEIQRVGNDASGCDCDGSG